MKSKKLAKDILALADIKIDGNRPWDIKVHNDKFYDRVMSRGSLGLGESYMDGWWDCDQMDELFAHILKARLDMKIRNNWRLALRVTQAVIFNMQNLRRARKVGEVHYDTGNDLYQKMLDKRMTYTCGYWKDATNLDDAQEAKYDLACRKIGLKAGDKILDIGGGWGSFARFAAKKYGAETIAITISKEQTELGKKLCEGLPIEIRFQDYREVNETFDHIVSFGMIEHVGCKNYREYMRIIHKNLKDDGFFLLHTIGGNRSVRATDAWISKYIFPNSMLPSIKQLATSFEGLFVMEDWHNFSAHYDKTLMAWFANFDRAWPELKEKYGDRFYRMWKYYLLACAGSFRARRNQLWQIVLSKHGVLGGYESVR